MRVVIPGGTGFVGAALSARLIACGHEAVILTRNAQQARDHIHPLVKVVSWAKGAPPWEPLVDGAGAVVNLAGESIAQRWTKKSKDRIVTSRIEAAERVGAAIAMAKQKPAVVVNSSAIGYYGPHGDEMLTEASPAGADFVAATCVAWEAAARKIEAQGVRVVRLRTGLVLGEGGGALAKMLPPFRLGAGGPLGDGSQWMSWIHIQDLVALMIFLVESGTTSEAVNGTAPAPVRMRDFAKTLGRVLHRPVLFPVPAPALRLVLGEMASMLLQGQRVLPQRAAGLGFAFRFPELEPALRETLC